MKLFNVEITCPNCEKKDCSLSGMNNGLYRVICYECTKYVFYCDEDGDLIKYDYNHTYNNSCYKLISEDKKTIIQINNKVIDIKNVFVNPSKAKKYIENMLILS